MTSVSIRQLHEQLSDYIGRARHGNESIIITSRDTPVAVLISIEEYRRLKQAVGESAE